MICILWVLIGSLVNFILHYYGCLTGEIAKAFEFKIALQVFVIQSFIGIICLYLFQFSGNVINPMGAFIIGVTSIETMRRFIEKVKVTE